jgi:hypothetical protein
VFTFNVLLVEFGAADFSGSGAAIGAVNQIGPLVTVLVVVGAGAMCADLGARTIREELDAMRVMGIDPVQALIAPRVLAATVGAVLLCCLVTLTGLTGGFFFSVFIQHVTPGTFVAGRRPGAGCPLPGLRARIRSPNSRTASAPAASRYAQPSVRWRPETQNGPSQRHLPSFQSRADGAERGIAGLDSPTRPV